MTTVDFYFNAASRLQVACRLAGKAMRQNQRMLVYAPDAAMAERFDKLLWTAPAVGFVPHCRVHDALAPQTPVLIASGDDTPAACDLILNLAAECPPHFERFARLLDVTDEEDREKGRARYRFYRERGYQISNHDLAKSQEDPA